MPPVIWFAVPLLLICSGSDGRRGWRVGPEWRSGRPLWPGRARRLPQSLPERLVVLPRVGAAYAWRAYIAMPDGAEKVKKMGPMPGWMLVATVSHQFAHAW